MTRKTCWLLARLVVALGVEVVFMALILPWCVKDSTCEADVWKDFFVSCGSVLILYLIWPAFRIGGTWLRIVAVTLCLLPAWLLIWVVLQHFEFLPRWFT